jgi:hypothetical protein|tara:strand:- start:2941 stop:3594 length:654 start_codon:yes stop_codon:yes gene_type:complete
VIDFETLQNLPEGTELKVINTCLDSDTALTIGAEIACLEGTTNRTRLLESHKSDEDFREELLEHFSPVDATLVGCSPDGYIWRGYWLCSFDTGRRRGELRSPAYGSLHDDLEELRETTDPDSKMGIQASLEHYLLRSHRVERVVEEGGTLFEDVVRVEIPSQKTLKGEVINQLRPVWNVVAYKDENGKWITKKTGLFSALVKDAEQLAATSPEKGVK